MKIFDYSDPVYPNAIMVYVQKGESFDFSSPADLKGKNVGTMSGWTYGDDFDTAKAKGDILIEEVNSDADNLQKLTLGRVDCVLAESTIAHQIITEQGYADQIEELPIPLIVFDTYLVFPKTMNQTALIETFNRTLSEMQADGSFDQLVSSWSGENSTTSTSTSTTTDYSGLVLDMAGAADNPPFLYADDAGNPTGLFASLYPAIFDQMGVQLNLQVYPWNRALAMAQDGEAPLAGIYKNDERMKIFDYSDPVYPNSIMVYVRKGESFDFSNPADLTGKSVGIMSG
jgi:ABC-type amino acid transport substrate-binding protein